MLVSSANAQNGSLPCQSPSQDVSENDFVPLQIYRTLSVRQVSGYAIDPQFVRMPQVCLGIFSLTNKRLVASGLTDEEGRFELRDIPVGKYRLVARANGFCLAIVPLRVVRYPRGGILRRRRLVLHMELPALDVCSYGSYR